MFHITGQTEKLLLGFLRLERFKMVNEYGDRHLQRQLKLKLSNSRITKLWDDDRKFRLPFRNAQFMFTGKFSAILLKTDFFPPFFVFISITARTRVAIAATMTSKLQGHSKVPNSQLSHCQLCYVIKIGNEPMKPCMEHFKLLKCSKTRRYRCGGIKISSCTLLEVLKVKIFLKSIVYPCRQSCEVTKPGLICSRSTNELVNEPLKNIDYTFALPLILGNMAGHP